MEVIKNYVKSYKEYSRNEVFKANNKHFLIEMINEKKQNLDLNNKSLATIRETLILILNNNEKDIAKTIEEMSNNSLKQVSQLAYTEVRGVNFNIDKNENYNAYEVLSFNKFIKCVLKYILIVEKEVKLTSLYEVAVAKKNRLAEKLERAEKKANKIKK